MEAKKYKGPLLAVTQPFAFLDQRGATVKAPWYVTMQKGISFLADLLVVTSRFKRKPCQTAFGVQYSLPSPFPGRHHPSKFETILPVPVRFLSRP
jgi:hypothetical protein